MDKVSYIWTFLFVLVATSCVVFADDDEEEEGGEKQKFRVNTGPKIARPNTTTELVSLHQEKLKLYTKIYEEIRENFDHKLTMETKIPWSDRSKMKHPKPEEIEKLTYPLCNMPKLGPLPERIHLNMTEQLGISYGTQFMCGNIMCIGFKHALDTIKLCPKDPLTAVRSYFEETRDMYEHKASEVKGFVFVEHHTGCRKATISPLLGKTETVVDLCVCAFENTQTNKVVAYLLHEEPRGIYNYVRHETSAKGQNLGETLDDDYFRKSPLLYAERQSVTKLVMKMSEKGESTCKKGVIVWWPFNEATDKGAVPADAPAAPPA